MSKKSSDRHKKDIRTQFDFDEEQRLDYWVKSFRKMRSSELLPEDSILDKYIKQHRERNQI